MLFLAWSDYGDLWGSYAFRPTVARLNAATSQAKTIDTSLNEALMLAVAGDTLWVGDHARPQVARVQAVGAPRSRVITLRPGSSGAQFGGIAADGDAAWATLRDAQQLWRIDAETNATTSIDVPYPAGGVAVGKEAVWVTVYDENR